MISGNDKKIDIAVIGAGPIGCIMAAHLSGVGHNVFLVDILKSHLNEIGRAGLSIVGFREMNVSFPGENLCYSIDELSDKKVDVAFIAVKGSIMPLILPGLRDVLDPAATLVSLQNGLDTEESIADVFGSANTLRVVVNYAGNRIGDGKIRMSFFNAPNHIGSIGGAADGKARELAETISGAGLETTFTENIKKYEWEKVILNAALSPVCALTRKTMKQMMDLPATRNLVKGILLEGIEVAGVNGIVFPSDFFKHCIEYLDRAGHHKTSMHVDVERGTPTEIGFLNEKIVNYGLLKDIPTPCNSTIVSLIKGTELRKYVG